MLYPFLGKSDSCQDSQGILAEQREIAKTDGFLFTTWFAAIYCNFEFVVQAGQAAEDSHAGVANGRWQRQMVQVHEGWCAHQVTASN